MKKVDRENLDLKIAEWLSRENFTDKEYFDDEDVANIVEIRLKAYETIKSGDYDMSRGVLRMERKDLPQYITEDLDTKQMLVVDCDYDEVEEIIRQALRGYDDE